MMASAFLGLVFTRIEEEWKCVVSAAIQDPALHNLAGLIGKPLPLQVSIGSEAPKEGTLCCYLVGLSMERDESSLSGDSSTDPTIFDDGPREPPPPQLRLRISNSESDLMDAHLPRNRISSIRRAPNPM